MEQLLAYWIDLQAIKFEDHKPNAAWMQAFPIGEYSHPVYGKIKMTFDRAKGMASNILHKVRGIDIAIDYGHDSGGKAAGWVSSAEARQDGLWLFVEWTEDAAADIRDGKYRYFSPEFVGAWKHPETGTTFKDVLLGGGLTNRPFLKNIMPVNLSEVLGEDPSQAGLEKEGGDMENLLKMLRETFKLAEDADEETIMKALTEALQADTEETEEDTNESLTEAEVAKILEEHPAMAGIVNQNKALAEQNKTLIGRVVNLELTGRNQSVSTKLAEWHTGGSDHKNGLPTALDEKITAFMLSATEENISSFTEIMDEIVKTGMVPLGESNSKRRKSGSSNSTALSEVETGIKKLMEDNDGMSYADASRQLFIEDETLYARYLEEMVDEEEEVEA